MSRTRPIWDHPFTPQKQSMNLYPHQEQILRELCEGKRVVCSQPRIGKTRPVIQFLDGGKNVVFTKKAAIGGWEAELRAMGVDMSLWTVTNHEKLRSENWNGRSEIWNNAVFDECHCFGTYPKPNQMTKPAWGLNVSGLRIGISATPCSETYAQLFHQAKVLKLPIWDKFKNFYAWHKVYGNPKSIQAHGRLVAVYTEVKAQAWDEFSQFACIMDRQVAVPDFVEAEDRVVRLEAPEIIAMCDKLRRDQVLEIDGHFIVADTPLALAQKCQQICAGVVLDENGVPVVVNSVKRDWIHNALRGSKLAVLTLFRAEVDALDTRGPLNGKIEAFQKGEIDCVVGNITSLNAGVDLSRAEAMVITSCCWSAEKYIQARERLLRRDRVSSAPVYFPVISGGIDEAIYKRVALEKLDFHSKIYV